MQCSSVRPRGIATALAESSAELTAKGGDKATNSNNLANSTAGREAKPAAEEQADDSARLQERQRIEHLVDQPMQPGDAKVLAEPLLRGDVGFLEALEAGTLRLLKTAMPRCCAIRCAMHTGSTAWI